MIHRRQHIPDIEFDNFSFAQIKKLFDDKKIYINTEYQRGDIWKQRQQTELIKSIFSSYSIGVLVLYINDKGQYEILDGQQRLLTIKKYLVGTLVLEDTDIIDYANLEDKDKDFLNGYSIYYLRLKSHDPKTKEEDIVQTFLRLQEGSPLNKAEKINAYRGKFKDVFVETKENHPIFKMMGKEKRFRLRQLAAEMLLLQLEGDFTNLVFPGLDLPTFISVINKYEKNISEKQITFFRGNLDFLHQSLNMLLTAITPRELIPLYLLVSYLRINKADNTHLKDELSVFAEDILKDLNSFSIYDTTPPAGMSKADFKKFQEYKAEARKATTPESIQFRLKFFIEVFKKKQPFILKDEKRLHDKEQKRILYFRQKGICTECKKPIDFRIDGSADHVIAHKDGGITDDLKHAVLLHNKCHQKLEKRIAKGK